MTIKSTAGLFAGLAAGMIFTLFCSALNSWAGTISIASTSDRNAKMELSTGWARERGVHPAGDTLAGKVRGIRNGRVVIGRAADRIRRGDRLGIYRNGRLINYCMVRDDGFRESLAWFNADLATPRKGDIIDLIEWPQPHQESANCLQEARKFLITGQTNRAIPLLVACFERDNRFWESAFLLSGLLFRENFRIPAEKWLARVIEGKHCQGLHQARPLILKGIMELDNGNPEKALWTFYESLKKHSPDRMTRAEAWAGIALSAVVLQEGMAEGKNLFWSGEHKRRALRQLITLLEVPEEDDDMDSRIQQLMAPYLPRNSMISGIMIL
ncbi:MAG: hypothetical protein CVV64_06815 [Candidatus Wallbacteria bacterium HGW-Wallbacteria-1]|jgi:hypothetical protein|uniref:Tetratricopeptide repeat protein n=1 Tax=Candidatus Wallbacteria bacterium HGW-Wallbacteria-1 TaxID=2013854 RepID=A0A2N1PSZ5_9BACT|nr:MAG: hypothetical protein CVV64_06815 [Candidatus Wallbacteria bacterium HGW-Wallbacteria-1]